MDYKEILDVESKKLLGLFNLLRATDDGKSLETLSKELELNAKTIIRSIKKLKKLFIHYQLENQLAIGCHERNLFYLKRDNNLYLEIFLVQYLSDLPEIIFLKTIIEGNSGSTDKLIETMSISESSLRRRANKINRWLKKYNMSLKRGSWELLGEEEQIRALVLDFYWFAYQGQKQKLMILAKENSRQLCTKLISFFNMQINDLQKEMLSRMIQITVWRHQSGYKVRIKKHWKQYIENSAVFTNFIRSMETEREVTKLNFEELTYIYLMIQAYFLAYVGSNMQAFLIEEHYLKKTTCYAMTLTTSRKLRQVFWGEKINHSKKSVVAFLGFHLYYDLISGFFFEKVQLKTVFEENYPIFTCKLNEAVDELIKENLYYQSIPKEALNFRYFMILSSLISPVYNEKRIFICLMTDLPLEMEVDIGNRITNFFMNKFNLVVIYARTSNSISYVDIILTTVVYQAINCKYPQPTLLIEPDISEILLFQIESLIKKVRNEALSKKCVKINK
ncbi:helix-turn-helix domain-containing protein [Enterococcus caccae]|uniref:Mga helix-turn-helix domain-containing protein n=1 Tax=Enterococcus caccae ATCC BAA-1240 TaxID=1158612 RepID=R3WNG3_9ENTE|nr:helix-turn-helix domain-containing protein [Enterococcus caccae]EOL43380.1 hypothetical protein UC7_02709 [Enterococcus caccae ATCC BAA-1240]EOT68220.1 hypothetical protein I580_00603 [Enterococcus caccae ATCC BAA-1240]OJG26913.1 hypothetical protein RU98_GL003004 [Enterococcus caccae]